MYYKFGFLEIFIFLNKKLKCSPNRQNLRKKNGFLEKKNVKMQKRFCCRITMVHKKYKN